MCSIFRNNIVIIFFCMMQVPDRTVAYALVTYMASTFFYMAKNRSGTIKNLKELK